MMRSIMKSKDLTYDANHNENERSTSSMTSSSSGGGIVEYSEEWRQEVIQMLLGTWTLESHAKADLGYFKAKAFVVMHVMPDPLQIFSCHNVECKELYNHVCQDDQCLDLEDSVIQGSDVAVFFQYGIDIDAGFPFQTHVQQNTSGWVGPYNWILPNNHSELLSRAVATAATEYLQPPKNCSIVTPELFDLMVGESAVHATIHQQTHLHLPPTKDIYRDFSGTCQKGNVQPLLPRILFAKHRFAMDYFLWSFPDPKQQSSLYKVWPSLKKHLPDFPVVGPYCFGGDDQRGYALNVSYDSILKENGTSLFANIRGGSSDPWKLTRGCVKDLPCWPSASNHSIPVPPDNGGGSNDSFITKALLTYGCYALALALLVSLSFNCQLSHRLSQGRRSSRSNRDNIDHHNHHATPPTRSTTNRTPRTTASRRNATQTTTTTTNEDENNLEEPLLPHQSSTEVVAKGKNKISLDDDARNVAPHETNEHTL